MYLSICINSLFKITNAVYRLLKTIQVTKYQLVHVIVTMQTTPKFENDLIPYLWDNLTWGNIHLICEISVCTIETMWYRLFYKLWFPAIGYKAFSGFGVLISVDFLYCIDVRYYFFLSLICILYLKFCSFLCTL